MEKSKMLVLFSGGQDSTTCLYWAKHLFDQGNYVTEVVALNINYGQRHDIECSCAKIIAGMANVNLLTINLGELFTSIGDSALLTRSDNIIAKHRNGILPASFVPGRNIILLTIAAMVAYKHGISHIVTGVCETDYSGYPDCRRSTISHLQETLALGMEFTDLAIITPLMQKSKAETVRMAMGLPGCMNALAHSHTCYEGQVPPCGKCPACVLRAKGFGEAGVVDPLIERFGSIADYSKETETGTTDEGSYND